MSALRVLDRAGRSVGIALATLLAGLSLTVLAPSPAFACSCAALTTTQSVEGADAVLLGTVEGVSATDAHGASVYEVRVEEVFVGMLPSRVSVTGSPEPCLTELRTGVRYVVFATWHDGTQHYSTGRCDGTAKAVPALVAEVERVAGDGRPPYDVPGGLPDDSGEHGLGALGPWAWTMIAAAGCGLVLLVCAAVVVVHANRGNR